MIEFIRRSKTLAGSNVVNFEELRDQVESRLLRWDQNCGTKCFSFKLFNNKVKGLRRGELTVLTGPTGSGKTTFLS